MNPQLQFRVWDNVYKEYWTLETIRNNLEWLVFPDNENIKNIIIEHSTGVSDGNYKLIFENDLVQAENGNISVVRRDKGRFVLDSEKDHFAYFFGLNNFKVIGNIHQPEKKK